jgi:hypothetical protein
VRKKFFGIVIILVAFQSQASDPTVSGFSVAAQWNGGYDWIFGGYGKIMRYDIVNGVVAKSSVIYNGTDARYATISPDGQHVAFFRKSGTLALIPAAGGTPVDLVTGLSGNSVWQCSVDWPVGDWVYYGQNTKPPPSPTTFSWGGNNEIWKVNIKTKQTMFVTKFYVDPSLLPFTLTSATHADNHALDVCISNDGLKISAAEHRGWITDSLAFTWGVKAGAGDPANTSVIYRENLDNFVGDYLDLALSPDGNTMFVEGEKGDIGFIKWDRSFLRGLNLVNLAGFNALAASGISSAGVARNGHWSCNNNNWIVEHINLKNGSGVDASSQALINWVDAQIIFAPGYLANTSTEGGDFWVSTTTPVVPARVEQKSGGPRDVRISYLQNSVIAVSVPFANAYEMRIMQADGRIVKAIHGNKAAVYNFTRQELKTGVYFVNIVSGRNKVLKTMVLY